MTKTQARSVLNEARDGHFVAAAVISYCLWVTGDLERKPPRPAAVDIIETRLADQHELAIVRQFMLSGIAVPSSFPIGPPPM